MKTTTLAIMSVLVLAASSSVQAQGRGQVFVHDPGYIASPGANTSVGTFQAYSNASSAFRGSSGGTGGGLLSNSLSPGGFNVNYRSDLSPGGQGMSAIPEARLGGRMYTPAGGASMAGAADNSALERLFKQGSPDYSISIGTVEAALTKNSIGSTQTIRSLVPERPSLYKTYLESGEKAFKNGDFSLAFTKFQMANFIVPKDAGSLLSMSHSQFAMNAYALSAYYLRQALRSMPRLAMVPLEPKAFYGDASLYVENQITLEEYVGKHPGDPDAQLLMAYYCWYDTEAKDALPRAGRALRLALTSSPEPAMIDAVESFWEGMVGTGKVSGRLEPSTRHAPLSGKRATTTQPAVHSESSKTTPHATGRPAKARPE